MSGNREFQPGDEVGDYRLEQRLGGGGFGSVWEAVPLEGGERVALKILNVRASGEAIAPLSAEIELLAASAASSSPNVVRVLGGGTEPAPHVVMEYVEGTDLAREIERRAGLEPPRVFAQGTALRIGIAIGSALDELHKSGIVHRDVKPANVMLDTSRTIKLADFGIAKIVGFDNVAETSQTPMSMAYAAPEVWEGQATHQSDIYALACVLFHCLTGRPPFAGSYADLFRQHLTAEPDWASLPRDVVPTLRSALKLSLLKDPQQRLADAGTLVELLEQAEREVADGPEAPKQASVREPKALGPWVITGAHPRETWTFLCNHETTGQRATVEVHFDDDVEYGSRLRKAVTVNPALVPLRAERLIDTNRLMFRPGEGWSDAPNAAFQFWVARDELPQQPGPREVDERVLQRLASQLITMRAAAAEQGLDLALPADDLDMVGDGDVHLSRPGLSDGPDDGVLWLGGLPLADDARALLDGSENLEAVAAGPVPELEPAPPAEVEAASPEPEAPIAQDIEPEEEAPTAGGTPLPGSAAPKRTYAFTPSKPAPPPPPKPAESTAGEPDSNVSERERERLSLEKIAIGGAVALGLVGTGLLAFVAVAFWG